MEKETRRGEDLDGTSSNKEEKGCSEGRSEVHILFSEVLMLFLKFLLVFFCFKIVKDVGDKEGHKCVIADG